MALTTESCHTLCEWSGRYLGAITGVQSHRGYVTRANKSVGLDPVAIDRPSGQPRLDAAMFGPLV